MDFRAHEIAEDGTESVQPSRIRFRSQDQIRSMLIEAGLVVEDVFGGFRSEPVGRGVGALVVIAQRP
ncbi:hypothetical protein HNR24_002199 [Nesterenkonia jeotgali]|uniref:Methyltransferase type 11 domain-containing protein n=1 Tax=Nesterenkonia jeotgali TaxID=317018 RepID=A0A839FQJ2_9MICC|nr:hypothetical protein [Nesterenkonia jeotgali]